VFTRVQGTAEIGSLQGFLGCATEKWVLDVDGTECSPGVRRMLAVVASESSFEHGRQQLELLAGLEVTTKAVERHAEAIGADIAAREQATMHRAKLLELPVVCAPAAPVFYIEMDGTGGPVEPRLAEVRHERGQNTAKSLGINLGNGESALHLRLSSNFSGRRRPSCWRSDFCSAVGSVIRRRRISRPSVVGRMMSAIGQQREKVGGENRRKTAGNVVEPSLLFCVRTVVTRTARKSCTSFWTLSQDGFGREPQFLT
jgi:hypothetical protein